MPEHRDTAPIHLKDLESFLWWDFESAQDWAGWRAARGVATTNPCNSYPAAQSLHATLRVFEAAHSTGVLGPAATERLNAEITRHGVQPRVDRGGAVRLAAATEDDLVGHILCTALQSLAEDTFRRFKLCRDSTCRASYYDPTKNGAKTWCSMEACGARNKMKRYRARRAR